MSNIKMMPLHTFELSLIITVEEYQNCRNILYATAKEIDAQCFDFDLLGSASQCARTRTVLVRL